MLDTEGLHARHSVEIAQFCRQYKEKAFTILLQKEGEPERIQIDDAIDVISLGAQFGTRIIIIIDDPTEMTNENSRGYFFSQLTSFIQKVNRRSGSNWTQ